jgi:hypothetical protein
VVLASGEVFDERYIFISFSSASHGSLGGLPFGVGRRVELNKVLVG